MYYRLFVKSQEDITDVISDDITDGTRSAKTLTRFQVLVYKNMSSLHYSITSPFLGSQVSNHSALTCCIQICMVIY